MLSFQTSYKWFDDRKEKGSNKVFQLAVRLAKGCLQRLDVLRVIGGITRQFFLKIPQQRMRAKFRQKVGRMSAKKGEYRMFPPLSSADFQFQEETMSTLHRQRVKEMIQNFQKPAGSLGLASGLE
jgi:hypothetical protein